uniref:C-X-C motif chemokine n=1 Tax=Pelusios castaneus TaxID=367368 RepID=A0A8C8RWR7_9SAUR
AVSQGRSRMSPASGGPVGLALGSALSPRAPMAGELRCQCVETTSEVIHPKLIAQVELIPEGPHCDVAEVIATTKHGRQVCLDPTAPWVKLIIKKILNRYLRWACPECLLATLPGVPSAPIWASRGDEGIQ